MDADSGQMGAKVYNFTLQPDSLAVWSEMSDFDIAENIKEEPYLSNGELKAAIVDLENEFPDVAEAMIGQRGWCGRGDDVADGRGDVVADSSVFNESIVFDPSGAGAVA